MTKILLTAAFLMIGASLSLLAQTKYVYVSDAGNFNLPPWKILKFDEDGSNGVVFIEDNLAWPQDIVFLEDKNQMLVSNLNSGTIARYNATTGAYINDFATGIGGPTRMKIGADGLLYVLQWTGNGRVWRYNLNGGFVDEFTTSPVANSIGLDWDAAGNLYVSAYNAGFVKKFSPTGSDLGNIINSDLDGPTNVWIANNGDIMVCDYNAGAVKRFNSSGTFLSTFISSIPQVEGVDFQTSNNILLGSGGTSSVRMYSSSGSYIKDFVPPGTLGLLTPNAVIIRTLPISSGTKDPDRYRDIAMATPSIGTLFQISLPEKAAPGSVLEIHNAAGMMVHHLILSDTSSWNASNLSDGIYFLSLQLVDGTMGRQKVVVQK